MTQTQNHWYISTKSKETRLFFSITFLIVVLDQYTKYLIETTKANINISFITIQYSTNTGAGFGILQNNSFTLGIISMIAALAILWYYPKIKHTPSNTILFALLLGGTIGNGIDRLSKQYVVDFIATTFWPSFNIADAAITIAVFAIIYTMIREEYGKKQEK